MNAPTRLSLPIRPEGIEAFDLMGNPVTVEAAADGLTVTDPGQHRRIYAAAARTSPPGKRPWPRRRSRDLVPVALEARQANGKLAVTVTNRSLTAQDGVVEVAPAGRRSALPLLGAGESRVLTFAQSGEIRVRVGDPGDARIEGCRPAEVTTARGMPVSARVSPYQERSSRRSATAWRDRSAPERLRSLLRPILRRSHQQLHRLGQPPAVPIMFSLGTVTVFMPDLQFVHQRMNLLVILAIDVVSREDQPLGVTERCSLGPEQLGDSIVLKILLGSEDFGRPYIGCSIIMGASQAAARPKRSPCRSSKLHAPQPDLLKPTSNRPSGLTSTG